MINAYYRLVDAYISQDTGVLFALGLALFLLGGWALVRRFPARWVEQIYVGQVLVIYAACLALLGMGVKLP